MKNLEVTQSVHSPQSSVGVLGIAMVDGSCLAIGMVGDDRGYCWRGDAGTVGDTVAGNLSEVFGENGPIFHANCRPMFPHPIIGMGSPL
jgi:hypothetical protein